MLHKNINRILAIAVGLLGFYILASPYLPAIDYWINRGKYTAPAYVEVAQGTTTSTNSSSVADSIPADNRLAIPKIGIDVPIYEGPTTAVLNKGLWHRPKTPTPVQEGNSVIVGHRFSYNPSIHPSFYNLDKVAIGDPIVVAWDKKLISYKVTDIKTVQPEQIEIEANTTERQLTLYTCTPLWTSKYRLVIIAKPTGVIF